MPSDEESSASFVLNVRRQKGSNGREDAEEVDRQFMGGEAEVALGGHGAVEAADSLVKLVREEAQKTQEHGFYCVSYDFLRLSILFYLRSPQ